MTIERFKQGRSRLIDLKSITKRRSIQSKSTQNRIAQEKANSYIHVGQQCFILTRDLPK